MGDYVTQLDATTPTAAVVKIGTYDRSADGHTQKVAAEGAHGAVTNMSGTITTGGTSQSIYTATSAMMWLFIQNPATETETLYVDIGRSADDDGTSIELQPGDALELAGTFIPTGTINLMATTTGHKFVAKRG